MTRNLWQWVWWRRGLQVKFKKKKKTQKLRNGIEWKRAACQHKVIMSSVQAQNNPRLEEQESTLPEALWCRRNNGCIPLLPPELWYQRAVHWFRQALSETASPQPDHISAGLLITARPPGLIHMPWKARPTQNDRQPGLFDRPHTKIPTEAKPKA